MRVLLSEWTKLRTTKTFWLTTFLFFFFAIGWAILMAKTATIPEPDPNIPPELQKEMMGPPLGPGNFTAIVWMLGLPVLMVQAIMMVTTEYSHRTQSISMAATPVRWKVALAKILLFAAIAALFTFAAILGSFLLGDALAKPEVAELFDPFDDNGKRSLWVYPMATALIVVFAQGMGWLLRQTAAAITLSLILYLGIDGMLGMTPKVGDKIINFAPFSSLNNFIMNSAPEEAMWGVMGNLWVFVAWAFGLWILGVILLEKRDV